MCGIFGALTRRGYKIKDQHINFIRSLQHRGPDDNGFYFNEDKNTLIGNTRLAIIDLENGKQPFVNKSNTVQVVQNGEIYNYKELREYYTKCGYYFETKCDTEVILAGYTVDGIDFIKKLNGMFSICINDENSNKCFLMRDRVGVKPLYYFKFENGIYFSSELKPLLNYNNTLKLNIKGLISYLELNYVNDSNSIYKSIYQIKPAQLLEITNGQITNETYYWRLDQTTETHEGYNEKLEIENESILIDSINIRNRTDVPICAFLSGGIDSSLIVALYSKYLNLNLETYTIKFDDSSLDESNISESFASYLSLKNHKLPFQIDINKEWDEILRHLDQPHGDSSFIPVKLLCKSISEYFKVVLTGDGGDEVYCGYSRFSNLLKYKSLNNEIIDNYISGLRIFSTTEINSILKHNSKYTETNIIKDYIINNKYICPVNKILYSELKTILPNNNMIKPDRMGMFYGVEARNPLLDYRLIELNYKIKKTNNYFELKSPLKRLLRKYDKKNIVPLHKKTFSVPYDKLKCDILKKESIIHAFDEVYYIFKDHFNYNNTIKLINKLSVNNEIRKLRNLMALFKWGKYSQLKG
jgi:asparagine synthase (glutamine-hydrolysing)